MPSWMENNRNLAAFLVAVVVMLLLGVGLTLAFAGSFGRLVIDFEQPGQTPGTVEVRRACYPGTTDAVYVARDYGGSTAMSVVVNGCPRTPDPGPIFNRLEPESER